MRPGATSLRDASPLPGALTTILSQVPSLSSPRSNLGLEDSGPQCRMPWGLATCLDRAMGSPAATLPGGFERAPLLASYAPGPLDDPPSNLPAPDAFRAVWTRTPVSRVSAPGAPRFPETHAPGEPECVGRAGSAGRCCPALCFPSRALPPREGPAYYSTRAGSEA